MQMPVNETHEVVECGKCEWWEFREALDKLPSICPECGKSHFVMTDKEFEDNTPDHIKGREEHNSDRNTNEKVAKREMDAERHRQNKANGRR